MVSHLFYYAIVHIKHINVVRTQMDHILESNPLIIKVGRCNKFSKENIKKLIRNKALNFFEVREIGFVMNARIAVKP